MFKEIKGKNRAILFTLVGLIVGIIARPVASFFWSIALSPMMQEAVRSGDTNQVRNLLQQGANPNQYGTGGLTGGTPLDFAFEKSDYNMTKLLIDAGADVNDRSSGYTPLMRAPSPQIAKLLLDRGANPLIHSKEGYTAWQLAKQEGEDDIAKVIMKYENRSRDSFAPPK